MNNATGTMFLLRCSQCDASVHVAYGGKCTRCYRQDIGEAAWLAINGIGLSPRYEGIGRQELIDLIRTLAREVQELDRRSASLVETLIVGPHGSVVVYVRGYSCLLEVTVLVSMLTGGFSVTPSEVDVSIMMRTAEGDRWEL